MKNFRATRSFFGDLGNIRRNQIVPIENEKETAAASLIKRGLLVEIGEGDVLPRPKMSRKKASSEADA
ncbi:hypothetical protein [Mesorhizobium sp.]|uniref:hypothetical protein n=1 Tax=Mesorhizobium sp. TaxID=1871066 RepID=UPI000FE67C04|nr:hypothetical protein [Mesorhizobium sp.]RWC28817.1 MAG: hypothetical protein EOS27_17910 [Mesorhizobium sp.]TIX28272.1 MAG: hypothetical protein E5V35_02735 [Mesorhizobium sp.]